MLEWASSGADTAAIQWIMPNGQLSTTRLDVQPSGSVSYQIPSDAQNVNMISLYVSRANEPDSTVSSMLSLKLGCPEAWFFAPLPEGCPDVLRTSNAAEQHFERGTMLWLEEFYWAGSLMATTNNRVIYVFIKDDLNNDGYAGYFRVFTDEWDDSEPASDPQYVPPTGLYQPTHGFGKIWRSHPEIKKLLGWAIDEEIGFVANMQADTTYKYPHLYIQIKDGTIKRLRPINYSWESITTEP